MTTSSASAPQKRCGPELGEEQRHAPSSGLATSAGDWPRPLLLAPGSGGGPPGRGAEEEHPGLGKSPATEACAREGGDEDGARPPSDSCGFNPLRTGGADADLGTRADADLDRRHPPAMAATPRGTDVVGNNRKCWERTYTQTAQQHSQGGPPSDSCGCDLPMRTGGDDADLGTRADADLGTGRNDQKENVTGLASTPAEALRVLLAFGDGTEGPHSATPELRRAVWGWVTVRGPAGTCPDPRDEAHELPHWEVARRQSGNVAGPRQRVNRAELQALVECVEEAVASGLYDLVRFIADSAFVERNWRRLARRWSQTPRGQRRAPSVPHADLWERLGLALPTPDRLEVLKVSSHLTLEETLAEGTPILYWYGNMMADALVEGAAQEFTLDPTTVATYEWMQEEARLILVMGVKTLLAAMDAEPKGTKEPRPPTLKATRGWREALAGTEHVIADVEASTMLCTACKTTCAVRTKSKLTSWLKSQCTPASRCCAVRSVTMKRQTAHESHELQYYNSTGVWICVGCGNTASRYFRRLVTPCSRVRRRAGQCNWRRIERGLAPGYSKAAKVFTQKMRASRDRRFLLCEENPWQYLIRGESLVGCANDCTDPPSVFQAQLKELLEAARSSGGFPGTDHPCVEQGPPKGSGLSFSWAAEDWTGHR